MLQRRQFLLSALPAPAGASGLPQDGGAAPALQMRISTLLEPEPVAEMAERILRHAYQSLGLELEVLRMPAERSLISANQGDSDGELYRRAGLESRYPNLLRVPVVLARYEIVAFATALHLPVQGWASLKPYRLGFVKGIKVLEENTAGMQVETVAKLQQAFAKLARGRCDLVLSKRITGQAVLRQMKLDGIHVVGLPLASFPVFHYLNRKHQGLLAALTAALQTMEREHSIARIQAAVLADF